MVAEGEVRGPGKRVVGRGVLIRAEGVKSHTTGTPALRAFAWNAAEDINETVIALLRLHYSSPGCERSCVRTCPRARGGKYLCLCPSARASAAQSYQGSRPACLLGK